MTWRTHVAIGTNAVWLTALFGVVDKTILLYLPVAVVASLLPDIDAASAKIHYAGGGVLGIFRGAFHGKYFHHRGIMHSFLVAVIFFVLLWLVFQNTYPLLAPIFFLSYLSHPVIDGFNTGVGYLYPFVYKRFALIPRPFRTRVGGLADRFLLIIGLTGLLLFFATTVHQLVPIINN